jgi:hypothetical protein
MNQYLGHQNLGHQNLGHQNLGAAPYGYSYPGPQQPPVFVAQAYGVSPAAHPSRSTATAALWCSVLAFFCFPFLGSILGIVLGRAARRNGYPGARATAGYVLGWIGLVLGTLAVAYEGAAAVLS